MLRVAGKCVCFWYFLIEMAVNTLPHSGEHTDAEILFTGPSKIAARDIYIYRLPLLCSPEQLFYDYTNTDLIGVYLSWKIAENREL